MFNLNMYLEFAQLCAKPQTSEGYTDQEHNLASEHHCLLGCNIM
jgi:hypothetical protein